MKRYLPVAVLLAGLVAMVIWALSSSSSSSSTARFDAADARVAVLDLAHADGVPSAAIHIVVTDSSVNTSWVHFTATPDASHADIFQGIHGYLHLEHGRYRVVNYGTAQVGCHQGAKSQYWVPLAVLDGFGEHC
jgi:hypothetical protein